ncbi:MAG TPA: CvpA family protein [Planctomycetaceae bacterium]|nr:CvpA family protein [Planctomycetaceae bacterium]
MLYDLFAAAVLMMTTARGAHRGFAWQVAGIASLVLCFVFATPLSLQIAPKINLEPPLNRWAAMLTIYLLFSFGCYAVASAFRSAFEKARFEQFDKHLGAGFGLLKGVIGIMVLTFFLVTISTSARQYILHTYAGYASAHIMDQLDPVMPAELHAILQPYIHELDGATPDDIKLSDFENGNGSNPNGNGDGYGNGSDNGYGNGNGANPRRNGNGYANANGNPYGNGNGANSNPFEDPNGPQGNQVQPSIEDLLNKIPALAGAELRKLVAEALTNTPPEQRPQLMSKLQSHQTPAQIRTTARAWLQGPPQPNPPPNVGGYRPFEDDNVNSPSSTTSGLSPTQDAQRPTSDTRRPTRHVMEDEPAPVPVPKAAPIAKKTIDLRPLIGRVVNEISSGEKQRAHQTEIENSLSGVPNQVAAAALKDWLADLEGTIDPDPQTDITTPLDARIVRQLQRANVPLNRLDQALRTRLAGEGLE